jgi:hypothetical protein
LGLKANNVYTLSYSRAQAATIAKMLNKVRKVGKIIIPSNMKPRPEQHEIHVASILAKYFKTDIEFIPRSNMPTPDLLINGVMWELKSPTGTGKNNVQRQLQEARRQSSNIIIDATRSKMHTSRIKRQAEYQFKVIRPIKQLLFVSKTGNVYEITR